MGQRPPFPSLVAALVAACLLIPARAVVWGEDPLVQVDTAFVTQTGDGPGWTIGNELIHYSLGREGAGIGIRGIEDEVSGRDWHRTNAPDTFVTINGQRIDIGSAATVFRRAEANEWFGGARLDLTYTLASVPMDITRSYACYPGSSVIETWTTFHVTGARSATVSDLTNFAFTVKNGGLHWMGGLDTPNEDGGPFTLSSGNLDDGQTFEIGADRRASEHNVPWFGLDADTTSNDAAVLAGPSELFGSILWSGQWRFKIRRQGDDAALQLGLPSFNTTLAGGASLEAPHAIFGMTNAAVPAVSMAIRSFVDKGIRHGRPFRALTTYNTWFSYGTFIDEASMKAEMDLAVSMGVEQFVVDAGWWANTNSDDSSDFTRGLGNWEVDPDRFPSGLGALTDYAHGLGMRFGVWVEPERIALANVPAFAKERFLATVDGRYDPGMPNGQASSAQICLADSEARAWVVTKLHNFLDDVHPDYLKWDNNFWINCNRPGHGHGTEDGNFQHMRALGSVLDDLRDRYPDMDIENCASGGHRLSLEMLAHTDAGWVDDQSSPSGLVRHNLEGLSVLFPPAYLFTFAMGGESESFDGSDQSDLRLVMRSRMAGMLGGTWTAASMGEDTRVGIANQMALYRTIRPFVQEGSAIFPILQDGRAVMSDRQVALYPDSKWTGWDAIEQVLPRTGDAVILAFDTMDGPQSIIVRPRGLRAAAAYDVESADFGPLGTVGGRELMDRGVELDVSGVTHSHVLIFHAHGTQDPLQSRSAMRIAPATLRR